MHPRPGPAGAAAPSCTRRRRSPSCLHLPLLHKQEKDPELPHFYLPIPGYLPLLHKQEKDAELPTTSPLTQLQKQVKGPLEDISINLNV